MSPDREQLERELASHLQEMAPAPTPDALSRASARIAATPQRHAWTARLAHALRSLGWARVGATLAVAAAALVVGVFIGHAEIPFNVGDSPSPSTSAPVSGEPQAATDWQEPASYSFVFADNSCGGGERNYWGRFRVFVEDGVTREYVALDETAERFRGAPDDVPTLADLMDRVIEAQNTTEPVSPARPGGNVEPSLPSVQLLSDPVDGHPVEIYIDWAPEAIDDEECYEISEFLVRSGTPSAVPTPPMATQYGDWFRIALPDPSDDVFGGTTPQDVTRFGGSYVAVGAVNASCCAEGDPSLDRGIVWTSQDGEHWEVLDGIAAFEHSRLRQIASVDGRLIVAGTYAQPRQRENGISVPALWISLDGTSWERVEGDVPSIISDGPHGLVGLITEPSDVSTEPMNFFAISTDGLTWERADIGWPGDVQDLAARDDGILVAVGARSDGGAVEGAVWYTSAGGTWVEHTATDAPEARFEAVTVLDGRFLMAGTYAEAQPDGSAGGAVWVSDDPTTGSWMRQVSLGDVQTLTGIFALDDALVAVGTDETEDFADAAAWISTDLGTWGRVRGEAFAGMNNQIAAVIPARPNGMLAVGWYYDPGAGHPVPAAWLAQPDH